MGELTITRRYWQCRCGADGSYAADEVMGLTSGWSPVLPRHLCRLGADVSFAKVHEHLRALLDVSIATETVRTLVESHGTAMAAFQSKDAVTAAAFAKARGAVEFAVDAGKVNTRQAGWRDLKIAVISKREAGEPRTPEQGLDDRLPAPTIQVAFGMIARAKVFRRTWAPALKRLGVTDMASVQVLGDGAAWIWKGARRALTGCTETLDLFHASHRVHQCAEAICGDGTAATSAAFERGRGLLLRQGWAGLCAWVGEWLTGDDATERERRRSATDRLLTYFTPHIGRLNYAERLTQGRAIGSGVVEGQAKTLGLRLKARGARWNHPNVRPMTSLICVRHSPQWNAYWNLAA